MKILIADDYYPDIFLAKETIEECGIVCEVLEAEDGKKTLEMIQLHKPDIILLDIKMPYLDGLEVLQWIRSKAEYMHTKVIMLTTSDDEKDILSAYTYEADAYITKPLHTKEFKSKIEAIQLVFGTEEFIFVRNKKKRK
jgi:CheY-like chemotaxis protein